MCIIAIKEKGVRKPADAVIKTMAEANPDGFGMMYAKDGELIVLKSMNIKDILKANKKITDDVPCVYHFRIATHGSIGLKNCHPFYDEKLGVGFAHNGILNIQNEGDMTDSETAFKHLIIPNIMLYGYDSAEVSKAVDMVIGSSKFALLNNEGELRYFGNYIEEEGMLYSNFSFTTRDYEYVQPKTAIYDKRDLYEEAKGCAWYDFSGLGVSELSQYSGKDFKNWYGHYYPELTLQDWKNILEEMKEDAKWMQEEYEYSPAY